MNGLRNAYAFASVGFAIAAGEAGAWSSILAFALASAYGALAAAVHSRRGQALVAEARAEYGLNS